MGTLPHERASRDEDGARSHVSVIHGGGAGATCALPWYPMLAIDSHELTRCHRWRRHTASWGSSRLL